MHVVWIHEIAFGQGGAERYVADTAALLGARGVRSTLLYDVKSRVDPDFLRAFEGAYPQVDLSRQLRELAPDVIYVHNLADERAAGELASLRAPVVRFFHDHKLFCLRERKYTAIGQRTCTLTVGLACYPCLGFVRRGEGPIAVRLVSVAELLRRQRANHPLTAYVVGSTYMREHVAAHGFDRSKIHVLPLYADVKGAPSGAPREPDLVLFAGQLLRGKGVDLLLRAIAQTRSRARLIVAGRGSQEDEFKALAARLGLGARVEFIGAVARERLSDLYARARCLAVPSRHPETFGLVGIEAFASGLPVIASDAGGIREWLEHGKSGIAVPPGDVAALARAIDLLVQDDELASAMGRRAMDVHRARFLPEHHVGRLHALFRQLAGEASA